MPQKWVDNVKKRRYNNDRMVGVGNKRMSTLFMVSHDGAIGNKEPSRGVPDVQNPWPKPTIDTKCLRVI